MVYNFSAEKRIYDLIEKASQSSLSEGSVVLNQALRALNQEFETSHYGDLPKHDVERFKVRKRIYEAITGAYDKLAAKFTETDYGKVLTKKNELESELSSAEELKKTYRTDLEEAEKQRKELEGKVGELEGKVEELTHKNNQLEDAQQAFRNI